MRLRARFTQWSSALAPLAGSSSAEDLEIYRALDAKGGAILRRPAGGLGGATRPLDGVSEYLIQDAGDTGPGEEQARFLMVVAFNVPDARIAEVDDWYEQEHIPLLMRADGWLRARRHRVVATVQGPSWTHIALHELRELSVMASSERRAARSTAWRARLEQEPWFPAAGRWIYERVRPSA